MIFETVIRAGHVSKYRFSDNLRIVNVIINNVWTVRNRKDKHHVNVFEIRFEWSKEQRRRKKTHTR